LGAQTQGAAVHFTTIQALRFVAAAAVVLLHSTFYTSERLDPTLTLYTAGANGVRLFFVISGLVMMLSTARLAGGRHVWRGFAARRIVRIVPLYWAVTAVKLAALIALPSVVLHAKLDWVVALCSFLFIPVYNTEGVVQPLMAVGWTLNIEIFFYALFSLALALRMHPLRLLPALFLVLTIASEFKSHAWPAPAYLYCDPVILDFLAGMLIARWLQTGKSLPSWLAFMLLLGGLVLLFRPYPKVYDLTLMESLAVTLLAACVVLGAVSLEKIFAPRLPGWLLFLGAASYSLYLIHPLIAPLPPAILAKLGLPLSLFSVVSAFALSLCAGLMVYLLFERPVTRALSVWLGRREIDTSVSVADRHSRVGG
jgi:exopolysaccharide production protein ExoZ